MGHQENSGNDPNTQLVPTSSGNRGSWKQPEEQPLPDVRTSALTAGSNWAGPGKSPGPNWQPPEGPYPTAASLPPRDRHLNPHEYPTLSAAAAPRPHFPRQPVPTLPPSSGQVRPLQRHQRGTVKLWRSRGRVSLLVACIAIHRCKPRAPRLAAAVGEALATYVKCSLIALYFLCTCSVLSAPCLMRHQDCSVQGSAKWDEDERQVPQTLASRPGPLEW